MIRVSAAEFQRNIGRYQDLALTEPVTVSRNGRDRTVMISTQEYQRLKSQDRSVLTLADLTEDDLAAIAGAAAPAEAAAFDSELDHG